MFLFQYLSFYILIRDIYIKSQLQDGQQYFCNYAENSQCSVLMDARSLCDGHEVISLFFPFSRSCRHIFRRPKTVRVAFMRVEERKTVITNAFSFQFFLLLPLLALF